MISKQNQRDERAQAPITGLINLAFGWKWTAVVFVHK